MGLKDKSCDSGRKRGRRTVIVLAIVRKGVNRMIIKTHLDALTDFYDPPNSDGFVACRQACKRGSKDS